MPAHVTVRFRSNQDINLVSMTSPDRPRLPRLAGRRVPAPGRRARPRRGKVLIADKLLAVAQEVGAPGFENAAWAAQYANAAAGAPGKALVSIDVTEKTVGF